MLKKTSFLCELFKAKRNFVNHSSQTEKSVLSYNAPAGKCPYLPRAESSQFKSHRMNLGQVGGMEKHHHYNSEVLLYYQ